MVSVVEYALLLFAVLAYIIGIAEQFVPALWIGSLLAIWSLANFASGHNFYRLLLLTLAYTVLGVIASSLKFVSQGRIVQRCALPLYVTALLAALLTGVFFSSPIENPFYGVLPAVLLLYALVAFVIMLVERRPELLVMPVGFTAWAIGQGLSHADVALLMMVYSVLCVLTFATQFVWKIVPPVSRKMPAALLHEVMGIGGQLLIVLLIMANGGLAINAGRLAFVGAGALFVLALLTCWYGFLQQHRHMV